MKDELLLVMLFLGFFFFPASLGFCGVNNAVPSPKAGAEPRERGASLELARPSLPLKVGSLEVSSFGCSWMLAWLKDVAEMPLYMKGGGRASRFNSDIVVPAVAGWGLVARGLGFMIGASEG